MIDALLFLGGMVLGLLGLALFITSTATDDWVEFRASLIMLLIAGVCLGTELYVGYKLDDQVW